MAVGINLNVVEAWPCECCQSPFRRAAASIDVGEIYADLRQVANGYVCGNLKPSFVGGRRVMGCNYVLSLVNLGHASQKIDVLSRNASAEVADNISGVFPVNESNQF